MKRIQKNTDIEGLKADSNLPSFYVKEIENQFFLMLEAEGQIEKHHPLSLPNHACIYHLNEEADIQLIMDNILNVEFVETEKIDDKKYFRIGLMQDHQMNLIYFLAGTFSKKMEHWLAN